MSKKIIKDPFMREIIRVLLSVAAAMLFAYMFHLIAKGV
jgi:hypothetical protein